MELTINWPYMFLFLAWLIPASLVKTRKEAISAMVVFLLIGVAVVLFSDSTHTVEVTSAEKKFQKYAAEMQTMGVTNIAIHANLLISGRSYSSLSALKDGKYYDDLYFAGITSAKGPQPATAFGHYAFSYLYKFATLLSCMNVFSHKVIEMTIRDGIVYLEADRAVFKQIGPDNIDKMMDAAASLHLRRLAGVEKSLGEAQR